MIKKKIVIKGVLTTESGLAIGGTKDDIGINTQDNPVVKNPLTNQPYIPGSSIKGKMRSLMELSGLAKGTKLPCGCGRKDCKVCKMFGANLNMRAESGQPRVLFRDAYITKEFDGLSNVIENKSETAIDRVTGTASKGSLRTKERIAAGVNFDYEIVILVMDGDDPVELRSSVETGLRMIESTGLGSKITAGYGKVNFNINADTYSATMTDFVE